MIRIANVTRIANITPDFKDTSVTNILNKTDVNFQR